MWRLLLIISAVLATPATAHDIAAGTALKPLTSNDFREQLNESPHMVSLVVFFAPWCGHCKALMPRIMDVADAYASQPDANLNFFTVDCTSQKVLCESFNVLGYPQLTVLRRAQWNSTVVTALALENPLLLQQSENLLETRKDSTYSRGNVDGGWIAHNFEGLRSRSELEAFAAGVSSAQVVRVQDASLAAKAATQPSLAGQGMSSFILIRMSSPAVGGSDSDSESPSESAEASPLVREFWSAAAAFGDVAQFVELSVNEADGPTLVEQLEVLMEALSLSTFQRANVDAAKQGGIVILRVDPQDNETLVFVPRTSQDSVGDWIWNNRVPALSPLTRSSFVRVAAKANRVVIGIPASVTDRAFDLYRTEMASALRHLARDERWRQKYAFMVVNAKEHVAFAESYGVSSSDDLPALIVADGQDDQYFAAHKNLTRDQGDFADIRKTMSRYVSFLESVERGEVEARGPGTGIWGWIKRHQVVVPVITLVIMAALMFLIFVVCYDEDDEGIPARLSVPPTLQQTVRNSPAKSNGKSDIKETKKRR